MKFTKKLAQDVAQYQFNWTLGCTSGTDDPDYSLEDSVDKFEQEFEESLEMLGINPTPKRVEEVKLRYEKLANKAKLKLEAMVKPEVNNFFAKTKATERLN